MPDSPAPKNTAELFRWLLFEPDLLREYSDSLTGWRERLRAMWVPMALIVAICYAVYLTVGAVLAWFDLPVQYFEWRGLQLRLPFQHGFSEYFKFFLQTTHLGLVKSLALGLALGFVVALSSNLTSGMAAMLSGGMVASLFAQVPHWNAPANGYVAGGLVFLLAMGLTGGLVFESAAINRRPSPLLKWLFFFYRPYFYIWYSFRNFFKRYTLTKNPFWWDGTICFPIMGMEEEFRRAAYENPLGGDAFVIFLFRRRLHFQFRLAHQVYLASRAGYLKERRNNSSALKGCFLSPESATIEIQHDWLFFKTTSTERLFASPTPDWLPQLDTTRQHLADFEQETNVQRRVRYFRAYRAELDRLCDLAIRQPPEWGRYFVKALELWQKSAADTLRDLELEAAAEEPIAANIYRGGEKLRPDDQDLLFGRNDLRDAFKNRVMTAVQMPLFFIQGQRRTGKSSLIAFLPAFLDRSFTVVAYDMQEQPNISLPALLHTLRERIHQAVLRQPAPALDLPEDWSAAWEVFKNELDGIAQQHEGRRIVLAIDEYEELHNILQTNPVAGGQVLAAMRSWSQSQNRVVFLFAGADFFSELRSPNWAEYFVQSERLLVDYLGHDDSLALIRLAGLHYPPELLERMFYETQGHPCLLQKICREIVTIANKTGRESRAIVEADYDEALRRSLLMPDDGVVNIFWRQFCENRGLKATVSDIIHGRPPADARALLVLEDHGFILRDGAAPSGWRMRVPLFEQWVRRYEVM